MGPLNAFRVLLDSALMLMLSGAYLLLLPLMVSGAVVLLFEGVLWEPLLWLLGFGGYYLAMLIFAPRVLAGAVVSALHLLSLASVYFPALACWSRDLSNRLRGWKS